MQPELPGSGHQVHPERRQRGPQEAIPEGDQQHTGLLDRGRQQREVGGRGFAGAAELQRHHHQEHEGPLQEQRAQHEATSNAGTNARQHEAEGVQEPGEQRQQDRAEPQQGGEGDERARVERQRRLVHSSLHFYIRWQRARPSYSIPEANFNLATQTLLEQPL